MTRIIISRDYADAVSTAFLGRNSKLRGAAQIGITDMDIDGDFSFDMFNELVGVFLSFLIGQGRPLFGGPHNEQRAAPRRDRVICKFDSRFMSG
jgi:hypothetical protein